MPTKKQNVLALLCTLLMPFSIGLHAYESEESILAYMNRDNALNCLGHLQDAVEASPDFATETHCKKTAERIIALFDQQNLLRKDETTYNDLDTFANSPMGQRLFIDSHDPNHRLFLVNICGSGHVAVIEKRCDGDETSWRIFQSWQNQFTLAQWIGMERWHNKTFVRDFFEYGGGKYLSRDQLSTFLTHNVHECAERMQSFRDCGGAVPYELEVTSFAVQ